jgi:hypothetical protein
MNENRTLKASYPILRSVFVTPTLLEAGINSGQFESEIYVKDAKELQKLKGGRAQKVSKRWAPLFVHNALFSGLIAKNDDLRVALDDAESVLRACGTNSWFSAFREAGDAGIPPSAWIKQMPAGKKQLLNSQEREWKNAANRVEAILTRWILSNTESAKSLIPQSEEAGQSVASLKKMARFKPSA